MTTKTQSLVGQRVRVYRNLRAPKGTRLYSVVGRSGRVIARVRELLLKDATFVVQPAGRDKVRREGRKNVHAFVVGTVTSFGMGIDKHGPDLPARITYNPHRDDRFVSELTPRGYVDSALIVLLNQRGVSASYTPGVR